MFFGFEQGAKKEEKESSKDVRNPSKRRNSTKVSASRPVSPTFSVNGDASQRRSRTMSTYSLPASPTSNGTQSRRNSQVPRMSISRATSPSGLGSSKSRRNSQALPPSRSVSPARTISSRAVSPARSEITSSRRRTSMYLESTNSTDNKFTNSRRTSLYLPNSTSMANKTNGTKPSNKSNKPVEDKSSRRQSLFLGDSKNNIITNRSDSVSSSSSESSSVSSISTPTTPEPSQIPYVVNGRLGVPTTSKIKVQSPTEVQSKLAVKSSIPSRPSLTRRSNTAPAKPRPKSIAVSDEPSAMLKKQATKRMSMIIESGR